MRSKQIKISINIPCGENFKNFEQTTKGGFCKNCAKEVIDFTGFSDKELFDYFNTTTDRVCGQFRPAQLQTLTEVRKRNKSNFKYIAAVIGALSVVTNSDVQATHPNNGFAQEVTVKNELTDKLSNTTIIKDPITLSGRVIDENDSTGLPGANIIIKGKEQGVIADMDGNFELILEQPNETVVLVISFIGYETQELTVNLTEPKITLGTIKVPLSEMVLGEVCVHRWTPQGIWLRIKHAFSK